jgi:hypothetical protein
MTCRRGLPLYRKFALVGTSLDITARGYY